MLPPSALVLAAAGKFGHARQAIAVAERLGLKTTVVEVSAGDPPPEVARCVVLVLAAGRQAIAPARRIARQRVGPVVAVLQPVRRPGDFELVWAPLHDHGPLTPRDRLETLTTPSAVKSAERAEGAQWLRAQIGEARSVGVLIGGASRSHRFGLDDTEALVARLTAFARRHGVRLAVTTSRRTGTAQTALIAKRLGDQLVIDGTAPDASLAYAGIVERAAAFIVTSDSVAMLSDAATTGKPIYGWRLPGGRTKFERFYRGLAEHGALRWFDDGLEDWSYVPLDAAATIAEALRPKLALFDAAVQHR